MSHHTGNRDRKTNEESNQKINNIILPEQQWGARALLHGFCDALVIAVAYFAALFLRFELSFQGIPQEYMANYRKIILPFIACCILVFYVFRLYHGIWRFAGVSELYHIILAMLFVAGMSAFAKGALRIRMPVSFWLMGWILTFAGITALRFGYRFCRAMWELTGQRRMQNGVESIMVVGAGSAGKMLVHELIYSHHIEAKVCCVIDDNPYKKGKYLEGVPIVGNRDDIPRMAKKYAIQKIIYAIATSDAADRRAILDICKETGCRVQMVPAMYQLVNEQVTVNKLRSVDIEDLLGRDQIRVDMQGIHEFLHNKVVMVTGGGGSIGSELCRQIAKELPKLLIIFDIYENNAYEIEQELKRHMPQVHVQALIGSVRNTSRVNDVLQEYRPEIIFHAAAHKHVPLMEESPNEAIKNNVFGTYKLAQAAADHGVKRFVLISTDKAVYPTNIMGASKRLCEMIIQMMNRRYTTEFAAVRFGNVLGSNGSVVPLFKKQIAEGGPVTVTDPRVIRYFMTIREAVSLVLQAGLYAGGGEIFVLDMGEPVKIDDLAKNLIKLSGYVPDVDIPIVYTGLRPGEKLYEEMLMDEEGLTSTPNQLIHIGKPIEMDDEKFQKSLEVLERLCESESRDICRQVQAMLPTYHPQAMSETS